MEDGILKNYILENFENPRNFFLIKSAKFCFVFILQYCIQRENVHNNNRRWARSALKT